VTSTTQGIRAEPAAEAPSLTPRALIIGLLAIVLLSVGTQYAELWVHGTQVTQACPPINSFFVFIVVMAVLNTALQLIGRRFALRRGELLLIYSMLITVGGLVGIGLVHFIPSMTTAPIYYGTPETGWEDIFSQYLPTSEWFAPHDAQVVRYLHEGMPPGWRVPWAFWWRPIISWTLFGALLAWSSLCACAIMRKQWVEQERLIFPLNYVPLAMTEPEGGNTPSATHPFFRNPLMWIGFAVPTVLHTFNSLHIYWLALPAMNLRNIRVDQGFAAMPWRALRPLAIWIYPMGIGLAYLLSRDISFSLWFFYFIGKAEQLVGGLVGMSGASSGPFGGFPFLQEQCAGALLVLTVSGLWVARGHLSRFVRAAVAAVGDEGHWPNEIVSPRIAVWGLVGGWVGILIWWRLWGMSYIAAASYFAIWFGYTIGLTRIVCEGGTVWIGTPLAPRNFLRTLLGTEGFSPRDWTMIGHLRFLTMDWRCLMMPNIMSSFKLAETRELQPRGLAASMMVAVVLASVVSFITVIWQAYNFSGGGIGLSTWRFVGVPQEPFRVTAGYLTTSGGPMGMRVWFMGVGAAVMVGLAAMRASFTWWPLHPIGYPMASTFAMRNMWFSTLVAWAVKSVVLKYGGIKIYERSRPLFLGLILGDFFMIALWLVVEGFTGVTDHFLYP